MPDFIKNIWAKAAELLGRLTRTQRIVILSAVGAVFIIVLYLILSSPGAKYVPVFSNLDSKAASQVMSELKAKNIDAKDRHGTIFVDPKQADKVRIEFAAKNYLPAKSFVGLEIFDKSRLSMTDYERKMNFLRAIQGELSRSIVALEQVEDANVLIVLPKKEIYIEDQKPPTAAIRLKIKSGETLSKSLVRGIINLVSHSVEGLTTDNITVVDSRGNTLSDNLEKEVSSAKKLESRSERELNLQRKEGKILEERINRKLKNVLGEQRVETIVKVELTFNTEKGTKKIYSPVYKEMGKFQKPFLEKGLPRSEKYTNEYYSGQGAVPGGVPGVESNIPGYKALLNSETTTYGKKENIINYELNQQDVQYEVAPVVVKKITVGVFVDWILEPVRLPDGTFKVNSQGEIVKRYRQRTPEELKRLQKLVEAAIGYDPARGDQVSVEGIQFTRTADLKMIEKEQARLRRAVVLKRTMWPVLTLIAIFVLFVILFQQLSVYRNAKEEEMLAYEKLRALKELENRKQKELEEEIKREEAAKDHLLRGIIAFTKRNPKAVADIVRTWLFES